MAIAVIDLFAGPGGLGEGFSSLLTATGERAFNIKLSIEMDAYAHRTLELRAFFREFPIGNAPAEYYEYLAGNTSRNDLFLQYRNESVRASQQAWQATLGEVPYKLVRDRIAAALGNEEKWVLIGGPPCQAYSLVGRSRRKSDEKFQDDKKHFLYREYLQTLATHRPPVFVMENVKGLLSAKVREEKIFERIKSDLEHPLDAMPEMRQRGDETDLEYWACLDKTDGESGHLVSCS